MTEETAATQLASGPPAPMAGANAGKKPSSRVCRGKSCSELQSRCSGFREARSLRQK